MKTFFSEKNEKSLACALWVLALHLGSARGNHGRQELSKVSFIVWIFWKKQNLNDTFTK